MKIKKIMAHNVLSFLQQLFLGLIFLCSVQGSNAQTYKIEKLLSLYELPVLKEIKSADDILQDSHGYVWIGSSNGLYKFDGYELTHYVFDPNKPNDIAGNWISGLTEDDKGNIWFGIFGIGLQKLDPVTGKFTLYKPDAANPQGLPNNKFYQVFFYEKSIWLALQIGIARLDLQTGKFKKYSSAHSPSVLNQHGTIWTIQGQEIGKYDPLTDSIVTVAKTKQVLQYPTILAYANDKLFLSAQGKFYSFNIHTDSLILHNPAEDYNVNGSLYDGKKILITTAEGKIISFDPVTELFEKYNLNNIYKQDQLINKFSRLKNGDIWISGGDKVFKFVDPEKGIENYKAFKDAAPLYTTASSNIIEWQQGLSGLGFSLQIDFANLKIARPSANYAGFNIFKEAYRFEGSYTTVFRDVDGDCWFVFLDRSKDFKLSYYHFSHVDKKITLLGSSNSIPGAVFGVTKTGDDIWVATWGALLKWNIPSAKETYIRQGTDSLTLTSAELRSVFKDRDDGLWVSSQTGLNYKRKNENHFTRFIHTPGNQNTISFDGVSSVTQDKNGLIWIATLGGGVNSYDIKTRKFEWYGLEQGLADNNVNNILVDDNQQVWVTHELGISRINPVTKSIENFTASDGIAPPFFENTSVKMSDGSLIFGGVAYTRILPDKVKENNNAPAIHLINFKLHNKTVAINGADSILHQNINTTKSLILKYNENVISFQYAALDMSGAAYRTYAYRLEGFDTSWQYVGNRREATFTNLSPGKYTLRIKSADANGQWQEMKAPLQITILPPWWKTWWAYTLYVLAFASLLWAFIQYRSRQLKAENATLEIKVSDRTNELNKSLKELKETQSQLIQSEKMSSLGELTAGIAHEIQNPLNFVNNFSEVSYELMDEMNIELDKGDIEEAKIISSDIKQNLEKINYHGKRADAIVKGMLQHSKSSKGQKELTDINKLTDEYLRLAYHGTRAKDNAFNATLKTEYDETIGNINIIPQDIGRVLLNLITNAFYAVKEKALSAVLTPTAAAYEPIITVKTSATPSFPNSSGQAGSRGIVIFVSDNGNGIPSTIIDKIFQPFFTTKPTGQGTGLGLSLAYDIVKAHGGTLTIENSSNGATFKVELPN